MTVKADPRLLAKFDGQDGLGQWRIAGGTHRVALGKSAGELALTAETPLPRVSSAGNGRSRFQDGPPGETGPPGAIPS